MIYINNSTEWVEIPKTYPQNIYKYGLRFVNQTTHKVIGLISEDNSQVETLYKFNIRNVIDKFEVGQYDYTIMSPDWSQTYTSGVLQYGEYKAQVIGYSPTINIIQYNPYIAPAPQPKREIDIVENGTYDVENYEIANVNVKCEEKPEETFNKSYTDNGTYDIEPTTGSVFSSGTVVVNVPKQKTEETFDETYTDNGTFNINPTSGNVFSGGVVNVNVPKQKEEQEKTVNIVENGTTSVMPDSGKVLSKVDVNVKVPLKLVNGTKLAHSSWVNFPVYDFSDITDWSYMFNNCARVTNIDFSDKNIIGNCSHLLNYTGKYNSPLVISNLNTSKVVNGSYLISASYVSELRNCTFDFSSCTSLSYAFGSLRQYRGGITLSNTSKVTDISYLFSDSNYISSISAFECDSVKEQDYFFSYVDLVKDIGGFINLGKGFISSQVVDLSPAHGQNYITQQSIQNIIDTIYDLNLNSKATGSTLKFREKMMKDVTDNMKQQIANKGWTLAY